MKKFNLLLIVLLLPLFTNGLLAQKFNQYAHTESEVNHKVWTEIN